MTHVITLQPPYDGTAIYICCSCRDEPIARVGFPEAPASLVEINHVVHEHIEAADREDSHRELTERAVSKWATEPVDLRNVPGCCGGQSYACGRGCIVAPG